MLPKPFGDVRGERSPPAPKPTASSATPLSGADPATPRDIPKLSRKTIKFLRVVVTFLEGRGRAGPSGLTRRFAVSLRTIVQALGGELYDRGLRANIPAPGHSAADRSVSLLLEGGRIVVHTFGDSDWRAVLDHLRAHQLIDAANAPTSLGAAREAVARGGAVSRPERLGAALQLWEGARPVRRTISERHCRLRGILRDLPCGEVLRHNAEAPVSAYRKTGYHRPALLAAIRDAEGRFTAVEVTYLLPNGRRAEDLHLPRKTVGLAPGGCAVRLDPAAEAMVVAEGVFTTLSASERFGLPGWALMSTRNLRAWSAPAGVRSVLIAADRGVDGEASAAVLRARLEADEVAATIALPPAPFGDWNEWALAVGRGDRPGLRGGRKGGGGCAQGQDDPRPGAGA
jgi:putative DNA primase/helicase